MVVAQLRKDKVMDLQRQVITKDAFIPVTSALQPKSFILTPRTII
jgi:hypothetical protein